MSDTILPADSDEACEFLESVLDEIAEGADPNEIFLQRYIDWEAKRQIYGDKYDIIGSPDILLGFLQMWVDKKGILTQFYIPTYAMLLQHRCLDDPDWYMTQIAGLYSLSSYLPNDDCLKAGKELVTLSEANVNVYYPPYVWNRTEALSSLDEELDKRIV